MKASKGEKRVSAILLWYDVAMPQLFYNAFHKLHLLLAEHNTTEEGESPAFFETF